MSTVIKANETGTILRRLSTVDLADHLGEARTLVEAAQRRAAQIVAEAQRRKDEAFSQAEETGYRAGYERGLAEGRSKGHEDAHAESLGRFEQQNASVVSAMQRALTAIEVLKEDLMVAARQDLLDFAVRLAGKLTFANGRLNRESAIENLGRALRMVESRTDLTIRLHPEDVAAAGEFARSVVQQADASRVVSIVEDASIAPGGCHVQAGPTQVDATLETQVNELVSLLLCGRPSDD